MDDKVVKIRNVGEDQEDQCNAEIYEEVRGKNQLHYVWFNIYWYVVLHSLALYGLKLLFSVSIPTLIFFFFMYLISGLGITAGAHRLWSHRSYQAKWPLQVLLMIFNTVAAQNSALEWCRDHRVHHKYSETHADPHNAKRGFFFAHMGWLMVRKHPDVREKGKQVSMADLERNAILKFQERYYLPLVLLFGLLFPAFLPRALWGESILVGFLVPGVLRYVLVLHATWLVNSLAHIFGNKPYDRKINPAESLPVCIFAIGEGFHNYHHTFPYDYSTSEFGITFNPTTLFINFMAWVGLAYDLKKVSDQAVTSRKARTGDGTPHIFFPFTTTTTTTELTPTPSEPLPRPLPEVPTPKETETRSPEDKFAPSNATSTPSLLGAEKDGLDHASIQRKQPQDPTPTPDREERAPPGATEEPEVNPVGSIMNTLANCLSAALPATPTGTSGGPDEKASPADNESVGGGKGGGQTFLTKQDFIDQTETLRQRIFSHTNLLNVGDC